MIQLTNKEARLAQLLVQGHKNRAIANKLGVAVRTVELHRSYLRQKLGGLSNAQIGWILAKQTDLEIDKEYPLGTTYRKARQPAADDEGPAGEPDRVR